MSKSKQDFRDVIRSGYDVEKEILKNQDVRVKEFYSFGFEKMNPYLKLALGYPIYVGANDGQGKAQPLTSKVYTPSGYKLMGNITIGDEVLTVGGNGTAKVIGVYPQGVKDVYEITFHDGSKTRCELDHLWSARKVGEDDYKVVSLKQIMNGGKWQIPVHVPDFKDNSNITDEYLEEFLNSDITNIPPELIHAPHKTRFHLMVELYRKFKVSLTSMKVESEQLANDILNLYRSLGMWVELNADGIRLKGEIKSRTITNIEKVSTEETQCIMIDSDSHLYFTDDFIVTHNTEFLLELQMQLSELYGMNHLVFSGEIGSVEDTYLKLYNKYGGKPYNKFDKEGNERPSYQTEDERLRSREFVNNHFAVVDRFSINGEFTFDNMINYLESFLNEGMAFSVVHTVSIDSWYELDREEGAATDLQLATLLQKVFRYGYKHKISFLVTSHVNAQGTATMLEVPDTKQRYPKVPSKYNWSGGTMWPRMGFQLINGYKPHDKIDYFNDGNLCEWNEFWVDVEKSKPESVGKKGRVTIFFNPFKNRYYEVINGEKLYSREWWKTETAIQPNLDFTQESDEIPF